MDIELPEMRGIEASSIMRSIEKEYEDIHTCIVAVSVKGKGGMFDFNFFRGKYECY